jgi:small subunit ribosomal protein S1
MDGLIHISELSWSHVNHPSEVLEIGQDVKVKVLDIDRERQRISLGLKQTQSDPWQQVLETYHEGDEVEGKVTKVVTFGAFVEIMPGVEGLVHISELAQHHVENPREVVSQGDLVRAKIIEVDAERRRLSLSLKRVEGGGVQQRADDAEPWRDAEPRSLEEVFPEAAEPVAEATEAAEPEATEPEATEVEAAAEPEAVAEPVEEPVSQVEGSGGASPRRSGAGAGGRARGRAGRGGRAARRRARVSLSRPIAVAITAASAPGRARRWPPSRATAPPRSRATTSSTTC